MATHTATGLKAVIEALLAREFLKHQAGITEEESIEQAHRLLADHSDEIVTTAGFMAMLREARERGQQESMSRSRARRIEETARSPQDDWK